MIIVRPIKQSDAESFIQLAFTAGIGMTSMPKNREILLEKITASERAFSNDVTQPGAEEYLFVLEDLTTGEIGGTCGINAKTGCGQPKYFYQIEKEQQFSKVLSEPQQIMLMRPVCYRDAPSEICSLYLLPEYRKEGLGRLLSLSRFLFAACHLHRFDSTIYAEMRGFVDKAENCPFWDGVGRHFLDIDYDELMRLRDFGNFDPSEVLPEHPIYLSLLPTEVQDVIGKIHSNTWPAYNMLTQEGFYATNEIDVFDGGPKIEALLREVRAVKASHQDTIIEIHRSPIESSRYIISNNRLNFRSCFSSLSKGAKGISISADAAEALQLNVGDTIRYVTPSIEVSQSKVHQVKESTP